MHFIKVNLALAGWKLPATLCVVCGDSLQRRGPGVRTCPPRVATPLDTRGGLSDNAGGPVPARRARRLRWAQLMGHQIVGVMGSDAHIRAMWVSAPDDQPAACICSSGSNLLQAEQTRLSRPRYSLSSTQSSSIRTLNHAKESGIQVPHF